MIQNTTLTNLNVASADAMDFTGVDRAALACLDLDTISVNDLADWLGDHGGAHLSGVERIELAERLTRRRFIIGTGGLIGAAALGACSAGEQVAFPTATTEATRTVATPRGSVTIPANPQRVIGLTTHDLANALALELPVIAGPGETGQPNAPFPRYLVEAYGEQLDDITAIAYQPALNFEQLTALQPDVILTGLFGTFDPGFAQLDVIAPTVTYVYFEGAELTLIPWREVLRQNGAQFDREDEAEAFIARFAERAADLRTRLASKWRGATYAIVEPYGNEFWLYGLDGGHTATTLTAELGLALADSVHELVAEANELNQGGASVSYELLGELDADVFFMPVYAGADGSPDRSGIETVTSQVLWATLPAVQAGQVYEFTGDIWYESGPMALAFLDVVERALLG